MTGAEEQEMEIGKQQPEPGKQQPETGKQQLENRQQETEAGQQKITFDKADTRYGINMKKFCRDHEAYVLSQEPTPQLLELHQEKIRILQHERLVHLIVTVMVVMIELFVIDLVIFHPETAPYSAFAMLGLAILLGFYFFHYFFLENTVQGWYLIEDKLRERCHEDKLRERCH